MHTTTIDEQNDPLNDKTVYDWPQPEYKPTSQMSEFLSEPKGCRVPKSKFSNGIVKKTPYAWSILPVDKLPKNVDWRNMDGRNYMSWNKN